MKLVGQPDQPAVAGFPTGVVGVAVNGGMQLGLVDAGFISEIVRAQAPFERIAAATRYAQQKYFALADGEVTGFQIGDGSLPIGGKQPGVARQNRKMREWRLPGGRQLIELGLYLSGIGRRERINSHDGLSVAVAGMAG